MVRPSISEGVLPDSTVTASKHGQLEHLRLLITSSTKWSIFKIWFHVCLLYNQMFEVNWTTLTLKSLIVSICDFFGWLSSPVMSLCFAFLQEHKNKWAKTNHRHHSSITLFEVDPPHLFIRSTSFPTFMTLGMLLASYLRWTKKPIVVCQPKWALAVSKANASGYRSQGCQGAWWWAKDRWSKRNRTSGHQWYWPWTAISCDVTGIFFWHLNKNKGNSRENEVP